MDAVFRRTVRFSIFLAFLIVTLPSAAPRSEPASVEAAIRGVLESWATAFNARDSAGVCAPFAHDLRYDERGAGEQTYADLCNGLRRALAGRDIGYTYHLQIEEILNSGDLAVVRLVLELSVAQPGRPAVTRAQEAMDVFRRQDDGTWKIIRFIAYDRLS
jgi:ketosteroid isomerase-like protein